MTGADRGPPAPGTVLDGGTRMNPMKILLVDDSKSARYALRLQLQRFGIEVEALESAEAALQRIREAPPDAVFMDHTMPGMNGFEALEILKAPPRPPKFRWSCAPPTRTRTSSRRPIVRARSAFYRSRLRRISCRRSWNG